MIEKLTKKPNYGELLVFFKQYFNYDFYITENNIRLYMTDLANRLFLGLKVTWESWDTLPLVMTYTEILSHRVRETLLTVCYPWKLLNILVSPDGVDHILWDLLNDWPVRKYRSEAKASGSEELCGYALLCSVRYFHLYLQLIFLASSKPQIINTLGGERRRGPWCIQGRSEGKINVWCMDPKFPRYFTSYSDIHVGVATRGPECCGTPALTTNDVSRSRSL